MQAKRLVAVVVPVARFPLTAEEEISIRHLRKHLGGFDRYMIGPRSLPKEFSDFKLKRFPEKYSTGVFEYNRLLLTEKFYRAFAAYEYILIYQLDCLVFAGNLEEWCRKGWDYVGAPWLRNLDKPEEGFLAVGNGGFSLRRVRSALAVFRSKRPVEDPEMRGADPGKLRFVYERLGAGSTLAQFIRRTKTWLHRRGYKNSVSRRAQHLAHHNYHEDYFWAYEAARYVDHFRIPTPREALDFSFETAPRYCLVANSGRMPFGCHAWTKYDRAFWEQFLLPPSR
jgi:uncharacterized protein DUF5672